MTAELKSDGSVELRIERFLPFPRELVFEAWTQAEHLLQWMGPTFGINLSFIELDVQANGCYRFGFEDSDCQTESEVSYVHGEYLSIEPPRHLAFTWVWEHPVPDSGETTHVTVDLTEVDGGTQLRLIHTGFPHMESRQRHNQGWNGTIEKLLAYLNGSLD